LAAKGSVVNQVGPFSVGDNVILPDGRFAIVEGFADRAGQEIEDSFHAHSILVSILEDNFIYAIDTDDLRPRYIN
jgi:hypothetical protein